jgi:hypothetical protein
MLGNMPSSTALKTACMGQHNKVTARRTTTPERLQCPSVPPESGASLAHPEQCLSPGLSAQVRHRDFRPARSLARHDARPSSGACMPACRCRTNGPWKTLSPLRGLRLGEHEVATLPFEIENAREGASANFALRHGFRRTQRFSIVAGPKPTCWQGQKARHEVTRHTVEIAPNRKPSCQAVSSRMTDY